MRLILVRHGDAFAGFHGPIGGPTGCRGLTDLGRSQADALSSHLAATKRLDVDAIVTSEIPRAIETARAIAPALGLGAVPQDCALCEVHTGEADGVDWEDYPSRFGSFDMIAEPDRAFAPGGDSWNSFHERVDDTMHRLASEHEHQTVMAVCHAGVIMASLRLRLEVPTGAHIARIVPSHTGLTEWEFDESGEQWTLRSYNDTRHLDPAIRSG
ncbi:histidine phosphatase family protein [Ilumatobacter nonamiensis]|uniref:histidine phosphatase family protein n=1 Tax=Ilumatobacter nonamiensis TaxID=467093 RepID=UPI0003486960|nr:histidine phosphatase family protein [Ilumatobacter nonamiensis]